MKYQTSTSKRADECREHVLNFLLKKRSFLKQEGSEDKLAYYAIIHVISINAGS